MQLNTFANHNSCAKTNPKLSPLQDNGGPTQTHAALPKSPLFEQGGGLNPYIVATDTTPYGAYAKLTNLGAAVQVTDSVDPNVNKYYQLQRQQDGHALWESRQIGVFNFALVPGS